MDITSNLQEILEEHNGGTFLFIGSGFSRRYLNLEDWKGLLAKFTVDIKPFKFYESTANGDLAKSASLIAEDFHDKWWELDKYAEHRHKYESYLKDKTSALRVEISNYLSNTDFNQAHYKQDEKLEKEIEILSQINIDGIITTNWDMFLEYLFPQYKKFIGQSELLFSNLLGNCEIYKIHGCVSNPNSLVLTDSDYTEFEEKNSYLASKLITIFVEHPIVFIGYSLNDENIRNILISIVKCLDVNNVEKLRKNLIFIQRCQNNEEETISESSLNFSIESSSITLPITLVKCDDFSSVYNAIHKANKTRFPVGLIRHLKEKIYELDFTDTKKEKISVVDIENIENYNDLDVVIGLGLKDKLSEHGYLGISDIDIIFDVVEGSVSKYDAKQLIESGVIKKNFNKRAKYLPVFKYLQALGVHSYSDYEKFKQETGNNFDILVDLQVNDLKDTNFKKKFKHSDFKVLNDILSANLKLEDFLLYLPFLDYSNISNIELDMLRNYLYENRSILNSQDNILGKTAFKKAVSLYDRLMYGWIK